MLLIYRFFADFYSIAIRLPSLGWHELVVEVLNLVDVSLTANLVLIVVFSGYENFISKVKPNEHPDWPEGLIEINFNALKQKVLGSIVIIAAVDALAWYLDIEKAADSAKLGWVIGFPLDVRRRIADAGRRRPARATFRQRDGIGARLRWNSASAPSR